MIILIFEFVPIFEKYDITEKTNMKYYEVIEIYCGHIELTILGLYSQPCISDNMTIDFTFLPL